MMEEASCIPGYRSINAQLLYRPQEDYAFVNDIKARPFFYNPYFRKEPEGPYVKEYHEKYPMGEPPNGCVFSPLTMAQQTMNRQCNPFVSYPYGVPRDPPYEKCSKCKGNKKSKKEKREKKEKSRHQIGHHNDHQSGSFASKLSSPIDYNQPHNEENHFDQTRDHPAVHYPQEGSSQGGDSPYSSFEMTTAHNLEGSYPRANGGESACDELESPIRNCAEYVHVDKPDYHYSYNEKANKNSQEGLQKVDGNFVQHRSDPHLSDDGEHPSEQKVTFDVKGEDQFSTMFADSDEERSSPHNAEAQNEVEGILSQYINDIKKKGPNGRKHQSKGSTSGDDPCDTPVRIKRDAEDLHDNEMVAVKMSAQEKGKTPKTSDARPGDGAKRDKHDKHDKQPVKQVKICEDENVWNKYSVTESCKKGDASNERLKVEGSSGRGAHDSRSLHNSRSPRSAHIPHSPRSPHSLLSQRDTERGKTSDHHGRACKQATPKNEAAKREVIQARHKRETANVPQMSTSNEEDKWGAISAKKSAPKHRRGGYYPHKDIMPPKRKTEKKELTYKSSKIAIGRTKSLRFRRGTVTFPTKNINFPHRKKSILSKQKSMVETKLKKQNTVALKRRKTMSRLSSMKNPPYTIVLNKKKVINTHKGIHPLENKKDKTSGTTTPFGARKMLARSKTKVLLIDNETKIFKKENVKMVSTNPFNPVASSVESSRRKEPQNEKEKRETDTTGSGKRESAHLSANADKKKPYQGSVRSKLKSKKEEMFQKIISLTKNMKEKPLKKKYNDQIDPRDLLSVTSNNSSAAADDDL
ncbi:hypothetical protein, conserved [Plasmodium vivax]|uniref:Uncharacterized protein n=1 Tax=Plasmodium vivax (strain Salvador I) TaxID=126793 RepID=A5K5L0_PLAVS|nr:hypothetical protein, conserved [Plasmodium vivax]EDL45195.1 hypothetical protein, conserved [Plasmodium vivax]|eukprot:XP_001614922.1 hypothetical protein [Plasmodium vivax Sal-1]